MLGKQQGKGGGRNGCPFNSYNSTPGYATLQARDEWLLQHGFSDEDNNADTISSSLKADLDTSKPLYFWQICSLIGREPIISLIRNFYKRIYDDNNNEWFKSVFTQKTTGMDHHISAQAAYWIDAMGGGRTYHGGNYRLEFHHSHNALEIMNARGAKQWMLYMRQTLEHFESEFNDYDPRIMPCIKDFLRTKMKTYSQSELHGWKFDESDFNFFTFENSDDMNGKHCDATQLVFHKDGNTKKNLDYKENYEEKKHEP